MEARSVRAERASGAGEAAAAARAARVVRDHGATLQRVARHYSLCAEDAQDAYQRALEIFWTRLDRVDPTTEVAWLKVVVKHEALAVRRSRGEHVPGDEGELELLAGGREGGGIEDGLASTERVRRSAEAIRRLKPDEATALLLKAEGHSYQEIGAMKGWTYTKVNRAITEGRRRFMSVYEEIESGAACDRYGDTLRALAAGTVSIAELRELRPHLRHCARCKAALRELRIPLHRRLAALVPIPFVARGGTATPHADAPHVRTLDLTDRTPELLEHLGRRGERGQRLPSLRSELSNLLHRFGATDGTVHAQLVTSAGGGRGTAVAALIGLCLSGAGAGVYCAATGVTDLLHALADQPPKRAQLVHRRRSHHGPARRVAKPQRAPVETAWKRPPTVQATATPASHRTTSTARPRLRASATTAPDQEFGFESPSGAAGGGGSTGADPGAGAATTARTRSPGEFSGGGSGGGGAPPSGGEFLP